MLATEVYMIGDIYLRPVHQRLVTSPGLSGSHGYVSSTARISLLPNGMPDKRKIVNQTLFICTQFGFDQTRLVRSPTCTAAAVRFARLNGHDHQRPATQRGSYLAAGSGHATNARFKKVTWAGKPCAASCSTFKHSNDNIQTTGIALRRCFPVSQAATRAPRPRMATAQCE